MPEEVLLSFMPEVSVQKSEIMAPSMGRPISELRVIDLQSTDLPHPTLVRLQTHCNILATHYIRFYF